MIDKELLYRIAEANYTNPYADVIPLAIGVGYPIIRYNGFILQNEEVILYVTPSSIYNDSEKVVGYRGSSNGFNVQVTKRISRSRGSNNITAVRKNIREYTNGDLIITNKRIVFIASKNGFEINISEITATKILSKESFILQTGNTSNNIFLNESLNFYVCTVINLATNSFAQGKDLYQEYSLTQNNMSAEHQQLYTDIRQQISTIKIKKKKNSVYGLQKRFFIILIIFIIFIIITLTFQKKENFDSENNPVITLTEYSDEELILMDNHPRIFDNLSTVEEYVHTINDSRVNVIYTEANKTKTTDGQQPYKNAVVSYDRDSSNYEFVGCFTINIQDSDYATNLTIENAVDIALSYLPLNFKELYKCDSSYIRETDSSVVYTYATRLNEKGVEYHNNGNNQYSNYLSIYFIDYTEENKWTIKCDYSAYGDKDKGWIEKYATPWEIQIITNP